MSNTYDLAHTLQSGEYVAVVLNSLTEGASKILSKAQWFVCADGGANHCYDSIGPDLIPRAVIGDFDSLRPDVKEFYRSKGSDIQHLPSQDENDITKSIGYVMRQLDKLESSDGRKPAVVALFGDSITRMDHVFGAFHVLFAFEESDVPIYLLNSHTVSWLLPSKTPNVITLSSGREGPCCGLIPLGMPCKSVTTEGLEWNLENDTLSFRGLVSSSNMFRKRTRSGHAVADTSVHVTTSEPLVWTMELRAADVFAS